MVLLILILLTQKKPDWSSLYIHISLSLKTHISRDIWMYIIYINFLIDCDTNYKINK